MPFPDAVRTCLNKYADFTGRATRSEFWWFVLFYVLVLAAADIVDSVIGTNFGRFGLVRALAGLALLLPIIAAGARRLHDTSRSGWWLLFWLVPCIGELVVVVLWVLDSHGDNKYGPSPGSVVPSGS
jgi:uncharacterized membrane protein YhaH (DUF805 family)